ncbi:hypothetical protein ACFWNK_19640 [Streptomyces sp. NPDC058417]|uniref:hypothetical protein n=1 Tax=unclassified Streptomyces TaxID=2593676 RepID=UPI0036630568
MLRSFGFLDTPEEDLAVPKAAARVLRPGALLGMDHFPPNSATAKVGTRTLKGPEATTTVHTTWDPTTARLNSHMSTRYEDGHVEPFHSSSRLYTPEDLRTGLSEAGFTVHGTFSRYDGSPLTGDSTRCIVVARRARPDRPRGPGRNRGRQSNSEPWTVDGGRYFSSTGLAAVPAISSS